MTKIVDGNLVIPLEEIERTDIDGRLEVVTYRNGGRFYVLGEVDGSPMAINEWPKSKAQAKGCHEALVLTFRRRQEEEGLSTCCCGHVSTDAERDGNEHDHYGYGACPACGMV